MPEDGSRPASLVSGRLHRIPHIFFQMGICKLLTVSNYAHSNAAIEDRNVALTTLCTQYTDYCQAVGGKSAVKASCDWYAGP